MDWTLGEALRVVVVGLVLAQLAAGLLAPPDPFTQLLWLAVALVPALAAAYWLVHRDEGRVPVRGFRPSTAFVVTFLLGLGVLGLVGHAIVNATTAAGGWSEPASYLLTDAVSVGGGALLAEWLVYRGGYDRLHGLRTSA